MTIEQETIKTLREAARDLAKQFAQRNKDKIIHPDNIPTEVIEMDLPEIPEENSLPITTTDQELAPGEIVPTIPVTRFLFSIPGIKREGFKQIIANFKPRHDDKSGTNFIQTVNEALKRGEHVLAHHLPGSVEVYIGKHPTVVRNALITLAGLALATTTSIKIYHLVKKNPEQKD